MSAHFRLPGTGQLPARFVLRAAAEIHSHALNASVRHKLYLTLNLTCHDITQLTAAVPTPGPGVFYFSPIAIKCYIKANGDATFTARPGGGRGGPGQCCLSLSAICSFFRYSIYTSAQRRFVCCLREITNIIVGWFVY